MGRKHSDREPGLRWLGILPVACLGLAVAACAQGGATLPPPTLLPPSAAPTAAATEAPTVQPVATPANAAPAEMLGKWTSEFATDDIATLVITATGISISRLGSANVRLEVFGDELVLSHSQLCAGEGRYSWSIEGDNLRFDSIGTDPCDGRSKSFDGVTYTRVSG